MSLTIINQTFRAIVQSHVKPAVAAVASGVEFYLDNQDKAPPEDKPHVRLTSLPGSHEQADAGSSTNRYRYTGLFVFSVFTLHGDGDDVAVKIADAITDQLRDHSTSGSLVLRPASAIRVGRAGKFWQLNVSCPYLFDRIA